MAKTRRTSPDLDIKPPGNPHPRHDLAWAHGHMGRRTLGTNQSGVASCRRVMVKQVLDGLRVLWYEMQKIGHGEVGESDPWTDRSAGEALKNEEPRLPSNALGKCA